MASRRSKKKKATEELVQTQVLNIDELRKVEKYEKKISKKPAGICALLGLFMILIGSGAQCYITYENYRYLEDSFVLKKEINKNENKEQVEEVKKTNVPGASNLICVLSKQKNANGTNYVSTFVYSFMDSKLKSIKKDVILDAISGNQEGFVSMANLYTTYKTYEQINGTIPGYKMVTGPRGDIGFFAINEIDLTQFNSTLLPENYQSNFQTKVEFPLDTDIDTVKEKIEKEEYTCNLHVVQPVVPQN